MIDNQQITNLARRIAEEFRPARIILFGSHANGTPQVDSDVDLLVVMSRCDDVAAKAVEIWAAVDPPFPIDLLVRTSRQVRERLKEGDFFIREIMEKGHTLYEGTHLPRRRRNQSAFSDA